MGQQVPMTALVRQTYNKVALNAGDDFMVDSEAEADDMVAIRMAVRRKPKAALMQPRTRDMDPSADAAESADDDSDAEGVPTKQEIATGKDKGYNRRDMRAKR